ncbi:MAG TPA: glycoside hydrolase family 127 protein [Anaerolineaceae bacterium]|nr:glycoside hydrolase family 127 protein [Anaerolineaceae bacterium]HPD63329.1 glycoside hydrolase family 127 protein [Anaerolineaceae bacterium]HQK05103.1 glycoside hydrolase family 127 protein [Anaerolineaceae bacterium]
MIYTCDFWKSRLNMNSEEAIFYQWEQLEKTRCIDNFRIAAGLKEGFREGYFFADSDAYKWLDAASRILARHPDPKLMALVDSFIELLSKAQCEDGYLYTYNQIHFGSSRWQNLQIEHELYCMGHLIEAGVSHFEATAKDTLLKIVRRTADLLVVEFMEANPLFTDGHEEIEIALIRLNRCTGTHDYLELARRFLARRGRIRNFAGHFLAQLLRSARRMNTVAALRKKYFHEHPDNTAFSLPGHNQHEIPRFTALRLALSALRGEYLQQHKPLAQQMVPVGHAVRFTYLQTAAAMLARDEKDRSDLPRLTKVWEHMVARRLYVTGGIGALPLIEGFGKDYELDPVTAYAETCAALGSMLWANEMNLLTGEPRYADLYEWQLYNAASVGIGLDGRSYFYNNPLTCRGGLERQGWYDIPCCPSNLSRAWASLQDNALFTKNGKTIINQYIPGEYELGPGVKVSLTTSMPWSGEVTFKFAVKEPKEMECLFRIPAWSDSYSVALNQAECRVQRVENHPQALDSAVGLHFEEARYVSFAGQIQDRDCITLSLGMPIRLRLQDKRVRGCGGMVALSRGPLVYCLESIDNQADIFSAKIDPHSFTCRFEPDWLKGTMVITGKATTGEMYTWIPYLLWGNRGRTQMTVFFNLSQ